MRGTTGADIAELTQLRVDLARQRSRVGDATERAADAIASFEAASRAFVPDLPPHRLRGLAVRDRVDAVWADVGATREALLAADRWVGARVARSVHELESARAAGVAGTVGSARSWALFRRAVLDADHPLQWNHAELKAALASSVARSTPEDLRDMREALNAENTAIRARLDVLDEVTGGWLEGQSAVGMLRDTRADVARLRGRAPLVTREVTEATGRLGRARAVVANSRVGAVARIGSRGFAVAGVGVAVVDVAEGFAEGDTEQVVTGALAGASSAALLSGFPPAQVVGAVVQGGLLVYEYRQEITAVATTIGSGLLTVAKGLF